MATHSPTSLEIWSVAAPSPVTSARRRSPLGWPSRSPISMQRSRNSPGLTSCGEGILACRATSPTTAGEPLEPSVEAVALDLGAVRDPVPVIEHEDVGSRQRPAFRAARQGIPGPELHLVDVGGDLPGLPDVLRAGPQALEMVQGAVALLDAVLVEARDLELAVDVGREDEIALFFLFADLQEPFEPCMRDRACDRGSDGGRRTPTPGTDPSRTTRDWPFPRRRPPVWPWAGRPSRTPRCPGSRAGPSRRPCRRLP